MHWIFCVIAVYLTSAALEWLWIAIAFREGGVWDGHKPKGEHIFFVFCPLINTLRALIGWLIPTCWPWAERPTSYKLYKKFFLLK